MSVQYYRDVTCDRCGKSFGTSVFSSAEETEKDGKTLKKDPAATMMFDGTTVEFEDLCDSCNKRVHALFGQFRQGGKIKNK